MFRGNQSILANMTKHSSDSFNRQQSWRKPKHALLSLPSRSCRNVESVNDDWRREQLHIIVIIDIRAQLKTKTNIPFRKASFGRLQHKVQITKQNRTRTNLFPSQKKLSLSSTGSLVADVEQVFSCSNILFRSNSQH